jgi:hypothetical protein
MAFTLPKKFVVGEKRYLVLKKNEIKLFEDKTTKVATFTYSRWAWFISFFTEIDEAVAKLVVGERDVKLQLSIGGGWYVSVTSGYRCVDVRKFYWLPGVGEKPTKTGLALRLNEWAKVQQIAREIAEKHPALAAAQPCWMGEDHQNPEGALNCNECNPFGGHGWLIDTTD